MFKFTSAVIFLLLFTGCVSTKDSLLPKGYSGGEAVIIDTYKRTSSSTADFYYSTIINDKKVANALDRSVSVSSGQGRKLTLIGQAKIVPTASSIKVHIIGYAYNVVPISAIFNSDKAHFVEGDVSFTPQNNLSYLINGILSPRYSAIWIEDEFGNIVSDVIERDKDKDKEKEKPLSGKDYRSQVPLDIFNSLKGGETFDLITKKLGQPTNLTPHVDDKRISSFKFKGLGTIQFNGNESQGYYLTEIQPRIGDTKEELDTIKRLLITDHGGRLRGTALGYYDKDISNIEALDLFAQKLWDSRNVEHRNAVDAMAWFCKILAKSGNNRYYDLLVKVSTESNKRKLRKYAKLSFEKLSPSSNDIFTPKE